MEWEKRVIDKNRWHRWFAWYPVALTWPLVAGKTVPGEGIFLYKEYVWLESIERRMGWQERPGARITISYVRGAQYRRPMMEGDI